MSTIRTLTEIWKYPIKSLPGIRLTKGTVLEKGLQGDRRMMLIDENNRFISQREFPQLALFNVTESNNSIDVTARFNETEVLSINPETREDLPIKSIIWDDSVDAVELKREYSQWFSEALKINCRLVYFPEENKRLVDKNYVKNEFHVSLADGYPYLIIGTSSLQDLSKRVGEELSMRRFRPNFVFSGGEAYEEDAWIDFKIGNVLFRGVKPCGRCPIPTINPETGIKGVEPLRTLATYRKKNNNVYFGQNVIAMNNGQISEGDIIEIENF